MNDEILVFNDVNLWTGKRNLFVKRAGQPVDLAKWMQLVPESMLPRAEFDQFEIELGQIGWYCLLLIWETRELFGFSIDDVRLAIVEDFRPQVLVNDGKAVPAVGWALDPGERLSGAIRSAAELYWGSIGRWPQAALVRSLPKGAPSEFVIDDGKLRIIEARWVWRGMVILL